MVIQTTETVSRDVSDKVQSIAPQIASLWSDNRKNLFEIGRILIEAKAATSHGEWEDAIDQCEAFPFKHGTAARLMRVAQCEALQRESVIHSLPPSVLALDCIVRCAEKYGEATLVQLVGEGKINADSSVVEILTAFGIEIKKPASLVKKVSEKTLQAMPASELAAYISDLHAAIARAEKYRTLKAA